MPSNTQILPNLIIGGSPKCGTSSLFYWLKDHPDVCASTKKETGFLLDRVHSFSKDVNYVSHGLDSYGKLFPDFKGEKVVMEATPSYMVQEVVPFEGIEKFRHTPKVVFLFRKPSERIFSDYNFQKNAQKELEKSVSFEDFLNSDRFRASKEYTMYAKHLQKWHDEIGSENVVVYILEELKKNPRKYVKELSENLGIDSSFWDDYNFDVKNKTVNISNMGFHMKLLKLSNLVPSFVKKSKLKDIYYRMNSKKTVQPVDNTEQKKQLDAEFQDEVNKLEGILGRKIDDWK